MATWINQVTKIQESDRVAADVVNKPLGQLTSRTDYIRSILANITSSEFNYITRAKLSTNSIEGSLVAFNTETKRHEMALAKWADGTSDYGSLKPADSAFVVGVIATKDTANTGTIITNGHIRDFEDVANLFVETNPVSGVYHLSADHPGKVTLTDQPLNIPVLTYDGTGGITLLGNAVSDATHDHAVYQLDKTNWVEATQVNFPSAIIPIGATYGYNKTNTPIEELLELHTEHTVFTLFDSGTFINKNYITVDDYNVWVYTTQEPIEDILAYVATPFIHGPGVIRSVKSDTDRITVSINNGLLTLNMADYNIATTTDASYEVVKSIVGKDINKGPVVSQLVAGPGIIIASSDNLGHGITKVTLASEYDKLEDANIINLNNAIQRTDGTILYTVFPANRDSSISLVSNVGIWTTTADRRIKVQLWIKGLTNNAVTPVFSVSMNILPKASAAGVLLPVTKNVSIPTGVINTEQNKYYLCEVDLGSSITVPSGAQLQYTIKPTTTPVVDYSILRHGIVTYI